MSDAFTVRKARPADIPVLADHRVGMFRDMGTLPAASAPVLREASLAYFADALPSGEYVAWVACPIEAAGGPIGGAGLQLRPMLPRPGGLRGAILVGHEGLVLNVYVDHGWRRRGVARALMGEVLAWARDHGVVRLVLHASDEGRPLYESLGFAATNEMRYSGPLAPSRSAS